MALSVRTAARSVDRAFGDRAGHRGNLFTDPAPARGGHQSACPRTKQQGHPIGVDVIEGQLGDAVEQILERRVTAQPHGQLEQAGQGAAVPLVTLGDRHRERAHRDAGRQLLGRGGRLSSHRRNAMAPKVTMSPGAIGDAGRRSPLTRVPLALSRSRTETTPPSPRVRRGGARPRDRR